MRGYIAHINDRNENTRMTGIYENAQSTMQGAKSEEECKNAAEAFKSISGFKDADILAEQCLAKAEVCRKDEVYSFATARMSTEKIFSYEEAIKEFQTISGWKDADILLLVCQRKIEEIKAKEEADRLEAERKAEEERIADEKAKKKQKKRKMVVAVAVIVVVAIVLLVMKVIIPNQNYNAAVALKEAGQYEEAITAFKAMNGYKDSNEQISACQTALKDIEYNAAVALMNAGKYEEAITAFEAMNGYKDSNEQISACQTALKDIEYNSAVALMNEGNVVEAYERFIAMDGYKDSAKKADELYEQYELEKLKVATVGDKVYFGTYEQDNDTENGKEDIEWQVLDKQDNKLLMISDKALDCKPYNTKWQDVTWETCTLRNWLNDEFLNTAFSTEEQARIQKTTVSADKNPKWDTDPGNATTDQVFLLSIQEANQYFASNEARKCAPTAYAKAQGAYTDDAYKTAGGEAACWWWLRSPGYRQYFAARVFSGGSVDARGRGVIDDNYCVRPALWIDLDS